MPAAPRKGRVTTPRPAPTVVHRLKRENNALRARLRRVAAELLAYRYTLEQVRNAIHGRV